MMSTEKIGWGQAQTCGGDKPLNWLPIAPPNSQIYIHKQFKERYTNVPLYSSGHQLPDTVSHDYWVNFFN
jgi:hypothetical protein